MGLINIVGGGTPGVEPDPPPPSGDILDPENDIFANLIGGFRAPSSVTAAWGDGIVPYYGDGFCMRYEAGDSGLLHMLAHGYYQLGYDATLRPNSNQYTIFDIRVPTLSIPGSPFVWSNWTVASTTGSRCYSAQGGTGATPSAGGYGTFRLVYDPDFPLNPPVVMEPILTGQYGLSYDVVSGRFYELYSFGYSAECRNWSFQWIELDYSDGSTNQEGPWKIGGIGFKCTCSYITRPPAGWSAAYTPGFPLLIGSGATASQAGACDVSPGLSAIAFNPPSPGATPQSALTGQEVLGYWPTIEDPTAGYDRANRNAYILPGRLSTALNPEWGTTKQSLGDYVRGGVFINTGTKQGMLGFGRYVEGMFNYMSSSTACEWISDRVVIYDIDEMAAVAQGTMERYELQPIYDFAIEWPHIDYTSAASWPYVPPTPIPISTITSVAGQSVQIMAEGAVITTVSPHGIPPSQTLISVRGTSRDEEYSACWTMEWISTTQMRVWNTSESDTWSGVTATGGDIRLACGTQHNGADVKGVYFDESTNILYFAISSYITTGEYFVFGYQLPS